VEAKSEDFSDDRPISPRERLLLLPLLLSSRRGDFFFFFGRTFAFYRALLAIVFSDPPRPRFLFPKRVVLEKSLSLSLSQCAALTTTTTTTEKNENEKTTLPRKRERRVVVCSDKHNKHTRSLFGDMNAFSRESRVLVLSTFFFFFFFSRAFSRDKKKRKKSCLGFVIIFFCQHPKRTKRRGPIRYNARTRARARRHTRTRAALA